MSQIKDSASYLCCPGKSFADAHALLKQAETEKEARRFDPTRWKSKDRLEFSFSYLIHKWYEEKRQLMDRGLRAPGYVPKLMTYIRNYYEPYFGSQDVREIFSCRDFFNKLPAMKIRKKDEPMSLKYQKNILDALTGFFNYLKEERVIYETPVMPKIQIPEYEPQTISREVQEELLNCIDLEHRPIFTFLFYQGCRPGEACALQGDCITDDVVTYKRTFSARKLVERTKTKQVRHNLIFPEPMKLLPKHIFPKQFVFTHGKTSKRPYSNDFLNNIFRKALRKFNEKNNARINITLYEATKHSFGTQLINQGVPEHLLQKWFGHTKSEMTAKYAKLQVVEAFRNLRHITEMHKKISQDS